ncbi:MAG: hypothetical protein QUU85_11545 [Candidatus Eisenbacteria bacterium]|nr:hypothetical protein [Candidatus Eisenbacteria bacterium]
MIGIGRKKLDFAALDHRKTPEVEAAQRALGNLEGTLATLQRDEETLAERVDNLGPDVDRLLTILVERGEGADAEELVKQRQAIRAQREAAEAQLRDTRAILREQAQLRRELEAGVQRAIGKARVERAEKVEAAVRSTAEALARVLREAASINADLGILREITGGPAGWPSPWPELDLNIHSALGMWLRDAEKFGCGVDGIEDRVDQVLAEAGARCNRRQQRRAEIEAKTEEIRAEDGKAAAERYLATASVEE